MTENVKQQTRVGKLSGGQQRRLDIALSIIGRPELLFLDEPTTGFDPEARRQFWDLINSLKAEGTSILSAPISPALSWPHCTAMAGSRAGSKSSFLL